MFSLAENDLYRGHLSISRSYLRPAQDTRHRAAAASPGRSWRRAAAPPPGDSAVNHVLLTVELDTV